MSVFLGGFGTATVATQAAAAATATRPHLTAHFTTIPPSACTNLLRLAAMVNIRAGWSRWQCHHHRRDGSLCVLYILYSPTKDCFRSLCKRNQTKEEQQQGCQESHNYTVLSASCQLDEYGHKHGR